MVPASVVSERKEQAAREEIASEDTGREAGKTGGQAAYRQWTIALRPQEVGVASKTIEFDEALALDLPYHKGVGEALHRFLLNLQDSKYTLVLRHTASNLNHFLEAASEALELEAVFPTDQL